MAPHLTPAELDFMLAKERSGKTPIEIHGLIEARRGPAMQKHRGAKRTYTILEGNGPTGYKSNAAKRMKETLRIRAIPFPRYSPDLNPLDFSLWQEVSNRMAQNQPKKVESVEAYKQRLKRTALGLSSKVVTEAILSTPNKIKEVRAAGGACIRSE